MCRIKNAKIKLKKNPEKKKWKEMSETFARPTMYLIILLKCSEPYIANGNSKSQKIFNAEY